MPDNPRQPEQHSDIPSSRHSAGTPGPSGSSYGGSYNPPPPSQSGPSNKIKNIIVGSIATIVTSTLVFLITQSLKKSESGDTYGQKREATTQAWDSYMAYENIYTKNVLNLDSTTADPDKLLTEVKKESEKFVKDLGDLKKRKKVDDDLIKVFDRRLDNEKVYMPVFEEFAKKSAALQKSNKTLKQKIDEQAVLLEEWIIFYKSKYERSVNDIREIGLLLSSRYPHQFDVNSFDIIKKTPDQLHKMDSVLTVLQNTTVDENGNILIGLSFSRNVKPASLTGKWTTPGMTAELHADGKVFWTVDNGGEASGTWKIENDKLKVQAVITVENKKVNWTFKLAYITANSFILANDDPPFEIYRMTRIAANQ